MFTKIEAIVVGRTENSCPPETIEFIKFLCNYKRIFSFSPKFFLLTKKKCAIPKRKIENPH